MWTWPHGLLHGPPSVLDCMGAGVHGAGWAACHSKAARRLSDSSSTCTGLHMNLRRTQAHRHRERAAEPGA